MDMDSSNRARHLSYPQKLFLWLLGYSLLLSGCFVLFQYHREKQFKAEELNNHLQLINSYIISELDRGYKPSEIDLKPFHPLDKVRVNLIDSGGHIVYDNASATLPAGNHLNREEIRRAMTDGSGYTVRRHSESTGNTYFYSATKSDGGLIVGTAGPYSLSLTDLLRADYTFLWIMGLISLGACILGYFATRRVGLHIQRLNLFAAKVESGARISDTQSFPDDELGSISNHLVRLYARLQQAYSDRDLEHRAALLEQREKERIKKQLTNNINHELKTPVASIRVCLETLLSHPDLPEFTRIEFLQRCMSNTDRLQQLLTDVAMITRMEDGRESIHKQPLNLAQIIAQAVEDHKLSAERKGIRIINEVHADLTMSGNRSLLLAVIDNLLDNAIAYSRATTVRIQLKRNDAEDVSIEFSDNGIGVPPEHMPHIFERFYRIDKGRSRASGGTGLGLAIVKNAVALHGGRIKASNLPRGGLSFLIDFKKT